MDDYVDDVNLNEPRANDRELSESENDDDSRNSDRSDCSSLDDDFGNFDDINDITDIANLYNLPRDSDLDRSTSNHWQ